MRVQLLLMASLQRRKEAIPLVSKHLVLVAVYLYMGMVLVNSIMGQKKMEKPMTGCKLWNMNKVEEVKEDR